MNVSQLTSKWNVPYLSFRLNSFSISEEYASVYCRNYASHRISESYAERILFFFIFLTTCPIPPLPCHTGGFCILGLCTLVLFSYCKIWHSRRVNFSMGNSFKYTCLVLNTFVNINILYVIMQLILLSGDLCCKHVLKVC